MAAGDGMLQLWFALRGALFAFRFHHADELLWLHHGSFSSTLTIERNDQVAVEAEGQLAVSQLSARLLADGSEQVGGRVFRDAERQLDRFVIRFMAQAIFAALKRGVVKRIGD